MYQQIVTIEKIIERLHAKGWTETYANIESKIEPNGYQVFKSAYIYPKAATPGGESLIGAAIYLPDYRLADDEMRAAKVAEASTHPTVKEHRMKELLETISSIENMAADLELPADFINPLTVMAEQLRSNAIEKKEIL